MLANGSSNAQIARSLGLSLKTIQNYVSRILDKLQVSDRTQAALQRATRAGSRRLSSPPFRRPSPRRSSCPSEAGSPA